MRQNAPDSDVSLGQVQADEICVKLQRKRFWLAMAVAVPFRLWLGAIIGEQRDQGLLRALATRVRACLKEGPLLVCVDGLRGYAQAFRWALSTRVTTRRGGRPRRVTWCEVVIGQVIKQYGRRRVVGVTRTLAQGSEAAAAALLTETQGQGVLNTAFIERLNATFRARLAPLVRRSRALARQEASLERLMYLVGCLYNFCTVHASRMKPLRSARKRVFDAGSISA